MSVVDSKFESMDSKATWKVEVLSAVDNKSKSTDVNAQIMKVTCRIENFSGIKYDEIFHSEYFPLNSTKWRIYIIPKPFVLDGVAIYLKVADHSTTVAYRSRTYAQIGVAIIDQIDRKSSITKVSTDHKCPFDVEIPVFSFSSLQHNEFHDRKRGYLMNDACLVVVYVSTDLTDGRISRDLMLQTDLPSEEDMNTFFTDLEAEIYTSSIVFSQEDAKQALSKVEEALNMTPINFYNSGKFYTLKHAINILARFNGSTIPIETEQKNELLVMEESLKELANRAAKAVKDKHHLIENQSMMSTITRILDRKLLRYKDFDFEVKQVEHKLAALLAERKEIFRSSQEIKMELEALRNKCPEYEAKAKVAEEEEKTVEAEWARLKDLISSIKEKI